MKTPYRSMFLLEFVILPFLPPVSRTLWVEKKDLHFIHMPSNSVQQHKSEEAKGKRDDAVPRRDDITGRQTRESHHDAMLAMTPDISYCPPTGHHAAEAPGQPPQVPWRRKEKVSDTFHFTAYIVSTRRIVGRRLLQPATHAVSDPAVLWPPMLPRLPHLPQLLLLLGRPASMIMQGTCRASCHLHVPRKGVSPPPP